MTLVFFCPFVAFEKSLCYNCCVQNFIVVKNPNFQYGGIYYEFYFDRKTQGGNVGTVKNR